MVIRSKLEHLKKVRNDKYDKACTKIYKAEGLTESIHTYKIVDLANYQSILKSIKEAYTYCIIEGIYKHELAFNIGEIKKAGKKNVKQLYFDGAGRLNEEVSIIPYKDILIIGFDNHYLNIFQKYLK